MSNKYLDLNRPLTRKISQSEKRSLSSKKFKLINNEEIPSINHNPTNPLPLHHKHTPYPESPINLSNNKSNDTFQHLFHNHNSKSPAMFRFDEDILTLRENVRESMQSRLDTFEMLNS